MKFAIARWTMFGFLPAFQAITASTANSGNVWTSARTASASPWDIRNSAASAPHATRNADAIIAGKVQSAVRGEAAAAASGTIASRSTLPRRNFIRGGYSMASGMAAIESPSNPLIRDVGRALEERTQFLLEGEKAILEAVAAGLPLEHLLHDASVRPGRISALSSARPRLVSRAVLERLADSRTPQHLLAIAPRRDVPVAEIFGRPGPVVFVFGIQDPGNLGAIVRVGEAAGCAGIAAAPGSADFFHPRAVRASAGSVLRIPVSGRVSFEPFAATRRKPAG